MKKYDVAVVGAGFSGICTAIILARENMKVVLLEQSDEIGGLLRRFNYMGHRFDTGFHYVGSMNKKGVLRRFFQFMDILDDLNVIMAPETGWETLQFPDYTFDVPSSRELLRKRLVSLFPKEVEAIDGYLEYCFHDEERIADFHFAAPGEAEKFASIFDRYNVTLEDILNKLNPGKKLRAAMCMYSQLYAMPPKSVPDLIHSSYMQSFQGGLARLPDSGDTLLKTLTYLLKKYDVEIKTNFQVNYFEVEEKNICGLSNGAEKIEADTFVCSSNPAEFFRLVPGGLFRKSYAKKIFEMKQSLSNVQLYIVADYDFTVEDNRYVYVIDRYDMGDLFSDIESGSLTGSFGYYVPRSGNLSSNKTTALNLIAFAPFSMFEPWADLSKKERETNSGYQKIKSKYATHYLNLLEKRFPGLREKIVGYTLSTPLTMRDFNMSERGGTYGIEHSVEQTGMRGLFPMTKIPNLFLVGQNIISSGIVGCVPSILMACSMIIKDDVIASRLGKTG